MRINTLSKCVMQSWVKEVMRFCTRCDGVTKSWRDRMRQGAIATERLTAVTMFFTECSSTLIGKRRGMEAMSDCETPTMSYVWGSIIVPLPDPCQ